MKRKLKKGPKLFLRFFLILVLFVSIFFIMYINKTSKVSNDKTIINFEVSNGSTFSSITDNLYKNNLIKSTFFYKLYIRLNDPKGLQAGTYSLSKNMSVKDLVKELSYGTNLSNEYTNITFKEGINMRKVIELIATNTSINKETIISTLSDDNYLNELITKYWFLTDDIKNTKIYYSLEGYLYPDTYQVRKNGNIKEIFKAMLDNMEKKLEPYKLNINNSSKSIHEIITLASVIELEASNSNDRNGVAGVFYNRLEAGWSLGSDVTTYYGAKIDVSQRDLYQSEIDDYNSYNTRNSKMAGKLPVGPICNASIESIEASLNPTSHNYYYFVADVNKKTYFFKTYNEHVKKIAELKSSGLWYEY